MQKIYEQTLAHIQNDNWDAAHNLIQDYSDALSSRIHGYLHRIEGDIGNASYWYHRAGMALPENTLAEELAFLCAKVLSDQESNK